MITIKHRFSGATLCEFDVETVKHAAEEGKLNLRYADLRYADLRGAKWYGANLRYADLRGADLRGADLRGADLYGANLRYADLRGADLRGADLRGADLYGAKWYGANLDGEKLTKTPLSVVGLHYWCVISDGYMRLGCKRFTHEEWANFNDEEIDGMDVDALEFWKQWKIPLLAMCSAHRG